MNAIVWYLLVAFTSTNSIVSIPQASHEDCLQQAQYIMANRYNSTVPSYAYCVFGVKQ